MQHGSIHTVHLILIIQTFFFYVCHVNYHRFFFLPAETEPHEGKRKVESLWPIFRLHHQRSRYIYDLFYKRKAISRGIYVFWCNSLLFIKDCPCFCSVRMWTWSSHSFVCLLTELYDYCIKEGYADKNLIAKWKKQGYENLCCLRCIQTRDTNFGTNCICRVPKTKLEVVSLNLIVLLFSH